MRFVQIRSYGEAARALLLRGNILPRSVRRRAALRRRRRAQGAKAPCSSVRCTDGRPPPVRRFAKAKRRKRSNVVNLRKLRLSCPRFSGESGSRRLTKGVKRKIFLLLPLPPAFAGPPSPLKRGRLCLKLLTLAGDPRPAEAGKAISHLIHHFVVPLPRRTGKAR